MRIDQRLDPLGPAHPGRGPDGLHPVGETRDEAEVFLHMLFPHPAGRDDTSGRERESRTENRLGHYIDRVGQNRLRGYRDRRF